MTNPKRPPVFREDGTIEIFLTRGFVAVIDGADAHLAKLNWLTVYSMAGKAYAGRRAPGQSKLQLLHRVILGLTDRAVLCDHKNGDNMDCRRDNLRAVTPTINGRNKGLSKSNKSGFVGVSLRAKSGKWRATIDRKHLGTFQTAEEANKARLKAEREKWGIEPQRAKDHAEINS